MVYICLLLSTSISTMIRTQRSVKRKAALAGTNKSAIRATSSFMASRKMNWFTVGASIFASNLGSEHFIGLSGSAAANGISVAAFEINALIILQLATWIFLPVLIVSKISTLPEYMQKRFGGKRIRSYLAILSILLYIFSKISVNLYSGGIFLQQAIGWNLYTSAMFVLALTSIMTLTGGAKGAMVIDNLQAFVMTTGASIVAWKAMQAIGGWQGLRDKYPSAIASKVPANLVGCARPNPRAFQMLRPWDDKDMPWLGFALGQTAASVWYWCADQMMVQRFLSARSLAHVQGSAVLAGYLKILPLIFMVIPGMISRCLFTDEIACIDPDECLKFCQSSVSCSNTAYPRLVLELMPMGARGMMVAAMVAALMNDLSNVFNSASALFSCDIWPLIRSKATQREQENAGRVFVFVLVLASIMWIPVIQEMQGGQLFIYIQAVAAMFAPPISAVYCCAVLWRRTNESGAFWAMMIGFALGCLRLVLSFMYKEPGCGQELDERPWLLKQVHYMYYAAFLFVASAAAAVLISEFTKPPAPFRLIRTTFWTRYDTSVRKDDRNVFEMKYSTSSSIQGGRHDLSGSTTNSTALLVANNRRPTVGFSDQAESAGSPLQSDSMGGSPSPGLFTIKEHLDECKTPDLSSVIVDISSEAAKPDPAPTPSSTKRPLVHQPSSLSGAVGAASEAGKLIASKLASEVNSKGAKAREMVLAAASHLKGSNSPISRIKFTNLEGDDEDLHDSDEQRRLKLSCQDASEDEDLDDDDDDDDEDLEEEDDESTGEEQERSIVSRKSRKNRSQSALGAAISSYKQKQLGGYQKANAFDEDEDEEEEEDEDEDDERVKLNRTSSLRSPGKAVGAAGATSGSGAQADIDRASKRCSRRARRRRSSKRRRQLASASAVPELSKGFTPSGANKANLANARLSPSGRNLRPSGAGNMNNSTAEMAASDMEAEESGKFYKCLDNSVALLMKTRFEETILRIAVVAVIIVALAIFIGFSLPPD